MRVLAITGDKSFGHGHPRHELQKSAVDELTIVYWGRSSGLRGLWPKIPQGRFDVVTVQDPFWRGLFACALARRLGARFNVQVHTDLESLDRGYRIWTVFTAFVNFCIAPEVQKRMQKLTAPTAWLSPNVLIRYPLRLARFVLRRADSVRVVSEKIKKQVLALGVRAPVHVLPIYVDVGKFQNIVRQPGPQKTILWIGRFEEEKDPLLALEVLRQIPNAKLIMLGSGSLENELRAAAAKFHLAEQVEFPGWRDPTLYLARADVVLCTSRHEGYGASIVEALAAGVPVVAPDVGVAKEAGAVVVPREQLAEAVKKVLQDGALGKLRLNLLSEHEWAEAWRKTLL